MLLATETAAHEVSERRHEKRGKDEIILTVYRASGGYTYSIQCRLGRFVRSAFPHKSEVFATPRDAKRAAVATVRQWTRKSRATKERLHGFGLMMPDQLEFEF